MKIFKWDGNRKNLLSLLWIYLTVNYTHFSSVPLK